MINTDPITTRIAETISLGVIFSNLPNTKYAITIVINGAMLIKGDTATTVPILNA